jgi:hypothetical protein
VRGGGQGAPRPLLHRPPLRLHARLLARLLACRRLRPHSFNCLLLLLL